MQFKFQESLGNYPGENNWVDVSASAVYWELWNEIPCQIDEEQLNAWKKLVDEGCKPNEMAALFLFLSGQTVSTNRGTHFRLVTADTPGALEFYDKPEG